MTHRVLIVDDEFGLAEIISELLSDRGYEVAVATNGQLGWTSIETQLPDLVLLDVMMPVMDGLTLLRLLRDDARFKDVPVVLMSSLPEDTFEDARRLCQQIVRKPFSPRSLFELVERWTDGRADRR